DPATALKDSAGYGSFSGASAIIYDHGDNAYTIYLRPEDGPAAVKIEASLTLEEMAALLSSIRLFDVTAGTDSIVREQGKILPELKEACEDFINQTAGFPMAGPTEILYDQAYPVTFTEGFLTERYKEEGSLLALAGENHQWRIPVFFEDEKSGEIRLTQNENGSWAVAGWLKNEEKEPQVAASMDAIRAAIDQNPQLAKAETVRILADALYNAVFVVVVSGGQEYVVPFGIRLEEAKIETGTGTVYTADDLIDLLERCFKEENLSTQNREEIQDNSDMEMQANIVRARTFDTFQELEENEKKQENGLTAYYVPAVLGEECSLIGISKREGVYLVTSYQVFTETIHPDAATAYERELVGNVLCTQYLFSEPDGTIEMFRRNNYQEMQYGGRVIYVKEARSQRDDSVLLGYEVVFAIDQTAFHIHLPAVNSFEEMLQFTELVKHVIE
ncbi:MAG: hypothetical protein J6128_05030, partial [Clostridia bacterium]|nr:hypothetical protein [Clostridia bacterium]